ncbi:HAMP domain-containing sensor histidine kinase [Pseudodesulfovibrio sp. zrk46]|uniref:sensor histidine kinase n=1 Tax=Pseudodesulfovibrio sp. zrk46 TaxID=2725288 RepID=UPI001448B5E3|nr:HAMP domain-containing sensor histidine kinase [Pseudodesulfovibrio sp. zrk46]QJB55971.1 HAMP domain-containing histidine kinase [Pseudodesulfovibrio sp. zrk46]
MFTRKQTFELLQYATIFVGGYALLSYFEAFETIYDFSRTHESYELDELFLTIPLLLLCAAIFAWRRVRDLRRQQAELQASKHKLTTAYTHIEQLSRFREEFIFRACSEIKEPLAGASSILKILSLRANREDRMAMNEVDSTLENMHLLIDDIASFAATPDGLDRDQSHMTISEIFDSVRLLTNMHTDMKGVSCHFVAEEGLSDAFACESGVLRLALVTLVNNAIKHTDTGRITVYSSFRADKDGSLTFTVTDTGKGIEPERLNTIFEPYTASETLPQSLRDCFGIGLPMIYRLIKENGGTLSVSSTPGQGSEFVLTVPAMPV